MPKLKFYDLGSKKSFSTDKYATKMKSGRKFAAASAPSGRKSWRILAK